MNKSNLLFLFMKYSKTLLPPDQKKNQNCSPRPLPECQAGNTRPQQQSVSEEKTGNSLLPACFLKSQPAPCLTIIYIRERTRAKRVPQSENRFLHSLQKDYAGQEDMGFEKCVQPKTGRAVPEPEKALQLSLQGLVLSGSPGRT